MRSSALLGCYCERVEGAQRDFDLDEARVCCFNHKPDSFVCKRLEHKQPHCTAYKIDSVHSTELGSRLAHPLHCLAINNSNCITRLRSSKYRSGQFQLCCRSMLQPFSIYFTLYYYSTTTNVGGFLENRAALLLRRPFKKLRWKRQLTLTFADCSLTIL